MGKVIINDDYCKACELCISDCPNNVLYIGTEINTLGYNAVVADENKKCIACKICAITCPEGAISVYK